MTDFAPFKNMIIHKPKIQFKCPYMVSAGHENTKHHVYRHWKDKQPEDGQQRAVQHVSNHSEALHSNIKTLTG